jgi:hypothetical protein
MEGPVGSRRTCLVLIAAALLAGCGDDDDDSGSTGDTQQSRQTPAQQDAVAKSDARNLATAVESCFVDSQDYSLCENPVGADAPTASVDAAGASTYTVAAASESGNLFRILKRKDGTTTRDCEKAGTGGCAEDGSW